MGGTITIESELGLGTTFKLRFKIGSNSEPKHEALEDADTYTDALQQLHGMRVLIIEDNVSSLRILKQRLSNYGMEVTTVGSLNAFEEQCQQTVNFDYVLIDYELPETNGILIARQLRTLEQESGQKGSTMCLIMLSSHLDSRLKDNDDLCQFHLLKPIREAHLLEALLSAFSDGNAIKAKSQTSHSLLSNSSESLSLGQLYPMRMLIVDDNATNRKVAFMMLERFGYQALTADDGREAVDKILAADAMKTPFDVVWMDLHMPVLDGLESTKIVRLSNIAQPQIVAMTAAAMHGDKELCLRVGMDDYVSKPLDVAELKRAIEHLLQRRGQVQSVHRVETVQESQTPPLVEDAAWRNQPHEAKPVEKMNLLIPSEEVPSVSPQYFDPNKFMAFCEGNPSYRATFIGLIRNMVSKSKPQFDQAFQDWQADKLDDAARAFHTMRGSLGTLGAVAFVGVSLKLEEAIKLNNVANAELFFVEVGNVLDLTIKEAQAWLDLQG
jgi:two-component system sensor histidine kinase/response regulator